MFDYRRVKRSSFQMFEMDGFIFSDVSETYRKKQMDFDVESTRLAASGQRKSLIPWEHHGTSWENHRKIMKKAWENHDVLDC